MPQTNATQLSIYMFLLLGAISALTPLAIDMYLPAMPAIAADFGVKPGDVQITLTVYTAGFALGQLLHGPLADSFGRKPILLGGVVLFGIGAVASAMSSTVDGLIAVRAAQGFAGAAAAVVIQAVVRDMFDREDFARTMSFVTLVMTVAPLAAPMIGGYFSVWFGWRSIFWLLAIYSVVVLIAIQVNIPETLKPENKQPFRIRTTLQNYGRLLQNKVALGLIFSGAFSFSGMFAFLTAGAFVYIDIYGVAPQNFGYLFGLNVVTLIGFTTLNGRIVKKMGSHWMLKFALLLQMLAAVGLFVSWIFDFGLYGVVPSVMLFVGTISTIGSNSMALLLSRYPAMAGTASSLAGTMRFGIGSLVGLVVSLLPGDQSWPMILTMSMCGVLSLTFYQLWGKEA